MIYAILFCIFSSSAQANPFENPEAVPAVGPGFFDPIYRSPPPLLSNKQIIRDAVDVIRIRVGWRRESESYELDHAVVEASGTRALVSRSRREDALGSYKGYLVDRATGEYLAYDSIGTGQEFRRLTRAISFRFPLQEQPVDFVMSAENPETGVMEEVLRVPLERSKLRRAKKPAGDIEVRLLREAAASPKLLVNIYAEGYPSERKSRFWDDAARIVRTLESESFPMLDHVEFRAVFSPSNRELGRAQDLGQPVPEFDSFLGLYFPYWYNFGRWYHVIYPTREERFRSALASVPYDYPIAVVNSRRYWGVGNYREHTAIPAYNNRFEYLLLHEIGHFFGLNEEYESGGKTELAFAPGIAEPWSQNITFLADPSRLKWRDLTDQSTPTPTPSSHWEGDGPYGAYPGGYAQTEPRGRSHKPGKSCVMASGSGFCPICLDGIEKVMRFDLGMSR